MSDHLLCNIYPCSNIAQWSIEYRTILKRATLRACAEHLALACFRAVTLDHEGRGPLRLRPLFPSKVRP